MRHPRQVATKMVAHALGAAATCAVLRQTTDLLGWLTWQVSSLFGKSAGMHFYSMGVSADSRFAELATRALAVILPLLLLGGTAEAIERLRRRRGGAALVVTALISAIAGAGVWSIARGEEASLLEAWVLGLSVAILCLLWIATYWSVLAGALRLLRRQPLQTDVA